MSDTISKPADLFAWLNGFRQAIGLPALGWDDRIAAAAAQHAEENAINGQAENDGYVARLRAIYPGRANHCLVAALEANAEACVRHWVSLPNDRLAMSSPYTLCGCGVADGGDSNDRRDYYCLYMVA